MLRWSFKLIKKTFSNRTASKFCEIPLSYISVIGSIFGERKGVLGFRFTNHPSQGDTFVNCVLAKTNVIRVTSRAQKALTIQDIITVY